MSIYSNDGHKSSGQNATLHMNIAPQPKAERAREPVTPVKERPIFSIFGIYFFSLKKK
jgi:hypothetical protein